MVVERACYASQSCPHLVPDGPMGGRGRPSFSPRLGLDGGTSASRSPPFQAEPRWVEDIRRAPRLRCIATLSPAEARLMLCNVNPEHSQQAGRHAERLRCMSPWPSSRASLWLGCRPLIGTGRHTNGLDAWGRRRRRRRRSRSHEQNVDNPPWRAICSPPSPLPCYRNYRVAPHTSDLHPGVDRGGFFAPSQRSTQLSAIVSGVSLGDGHGGRAA
jgi:hypothetical protein